MARASRSTQLANYFYWFLTVECLEDKDPTTRERFERIRHKFMENLGNVSLVGGGVCESDREGV